MRKVKQRKGRLKTSSQCTYFALASKRDERRGERCMNMNAQPAKLPKTVSPVSLLQISYFGSLRSFDLFSLPSWLRNGIGPLPCLEGPLACGVMEYIYTGSTPNTNQHQPPELPRTAVSGRLGYACNLTKVICASYSTGFDRSGGRCLPTVYRYGIWRVSRT